MEAQILREEEQDRGFLDQLAALPEGARLRSCLQCGSCGGACPVSPFLPHTPRRLFAMVRAGMKRQVLESLTPWVCSSCYQCTVSCPAGIHITEIMYALKRIGGREGITPPESDAIRFAAAFTRSVSRFGRAHELGVLTRYMALHHPLQMMGQSGTGMMLMSRGRMPLRAHRIKDRAGLSKLVERALALEEKAP